jgi:serine/threonine-protein kinase
MSVGAREVVGGYRLLEVLGAGGGGTVYLAESTDGLGKRVALKRFAPEARKGFERELEAYRRIEEIRRRGGSPHLVEGLAAGALADGGGFIALAYEPGGTLADRGAGEGPLPWREAAAVAEDVLAALASLHDAGLCHRDVKPQNVLLGRDGRARLGDFGLATARDGGISTGGSPAFAAPEQWETADADARAGVAIDVYGAGATLYWLLTGRAPRPGAPDLFLLESRRVPRELQRALRRALAAEPGERFASAAGFREAIRAAREAPEHPPRARARATAGVGAVLAAGAVLLAAAVGIRGRTGPSANAISGRTSPSGNDRGPQCRLAQGTATEAPRLLIAGGPAIPLPGAPTALAILPDGRVAVGTADGAVLLYDPAAPAREPAPLASFGHAVLSLEWRDGALRARGDDRRPSPLAAAEAAPGGSIAVEGAAGRYAFPREPVIREIAIEVPGRSEAP